MFAAIDKAQVSANRVVHRQLEAMGLLWLQSPQMLYAFAWAIHIVDFITDVMFYTNDLSGTLNNELNITDVGTLNNELSGSFPQSTPPQHKQCTSIRMPDLRIVALVSIVCSAAVLVWRLSYASMMKEINYAIDHRAGKIAEAAGNRAQLLVNTGDENAVSVEKTLHAATAVPFNKVQQTIRQGFEQVQSYTTKRNHTAQAAENLHGDDLRKELIRKEKISGVLTATLENFVQLALVVTVATCKGGAGLSQTGWSSLVAGVLSTLYLLYKSYVASTSIGATQDRTALELLFVATGGHQWKASRNWCKNKPLDKWEGVGTDEMGRVTKINLYNNGLVGRCYFVIIKTDLQ